jgi:hypothetical protein
LPDDRSGARFFLRGLVWGTSARVKRFAFKVGPATTAAPFPLPGAGMDAKDWVFILGLPLLALLLTGPGLWSENWGWGVLDRLLRRKKKEKAPPSDNRPP